MRHVITALSVVTALSSFSAFAEEQTVKLSVPGMHCASCPYMVEQAVTMVEGVKSVEATMEDRSATVTYDDTVTTVEAIRGATAAIGYDSTVVEADTKS